MANIKVSVVLTVLNEISSIELTIDSLVHQTKKPSEIIVVDGGSTDGTFDYLKKQKNIRSFQKTGNRSVGRNYGVSVSKSPFIAFTDAGCIAHPDWLEELTNLKGDIISGYYEGSAKTIFQKCLIPYVLVMPDVATKTEFFPASRSMLIRKSVFQLAGGFDEKLWHNEDYALAHKLKNLGYYFIFAPRAIVTWQPRTNLKQAAWMFMRFAIGDIQAGIVRPKVKLLLTRYSVFLFSFFVILEFNKSSALLFAVASLVSYSIWAVLKNYKHVQDPHAFFWLPVLQLTADACVIFGSLVALLSR